MHRLVQIARPTRLSRSAQPVARQPLVPRTPKRNEGLYLPESRLPDTSFAFEDHSFQPDPYLDYGRFLTDEGGVLFIFKDIDVRLRQTVWRLFAWGLFTGVEAFYLSPFLPMGEQWRAIACLLAVAAVNYLIVRKPVELYRHIEVRPDCLILEGNDVFWSRYMEGGYPGFQPDEKENKVLCGIYGTRFVEYLTVRRFDEQDRMMEVFAAHLQDAMQQQWSRHQ